jgi:hypothetical protein
MDGFIIRTTRDTLKWNSDSVQTARLWLEEAFDGLTVSQSLNNPIFDTKATDPHA